MKKAILLTIIFCWMSPSTSILAATYDATGRWNFLASGNYNNCGEPSGSNESGTAVLIQNENSFLLIITSSTADNLKTVSGTINGAVYRFTDRYWEDGGWANDTVTFTLSSLSSGSGSGSWVWSGGGDSCSGGYTLSLTQQSQNTPAYDASGTWNFNQTSFWNNCDETNPASVPGTMTLKQNRNRFTATDSIGGTWKGFVSGATYTFVNSYAEDGGVSSDICTVNLSSAAQGNGQCLWVWDLDGNSSDHCEGGSNISIAKQATITKSKAMSWLQLLFE